MSTTELQEEEKRIQAIDQQTALSICSLAAIKTHDALGNIMPHVWCQRTDIQKQIDLINSSDVRKIMLDQLKKNLEAKKDLILELDQTEPVIKWIVHYSKSWEIKFQEARQQQCDIAEFTYSAMQEAFFQLENWIEDVFPGQLTDLKNKIKRLSNIDSFVLTQQCLIRFLFRVDSIQPTLSRFTAKVMQQREVCSKPGVYSASKQFNNIQQQQAQALYECLNLLEEELPAVFQMPDEYIGLRIIDYARKSKRLFNEHQST